MKRAIICFTRVPRPGRTKTRLLPILSGEQCAALHTAFLRDLNTLYTGLDCDVIISYAPDPDRSALEEVFPAAASFWPQQGEDLGQRMHNAFCRAFQKGYAAVVLTGSDLPELDQSCLAKAFTALETNDVVLGPTSDGGYYLIGMKAPCAQVFQGHPYGGATVWESTMAAIAAANLTVAAAPGLDDVDTPEDLLRLAKTVRPESHTGRCLNQLKKAGVDL